MAETSYRLNAVSVSGGFLDGFSFAFSDCLNCIIGARGTGKTSLIEFIRYALKLEPQDDSGRKRFDSFIEGNLRGGTIVLAVTSSDGSRYQVRRTWNEEPVVMTVDGIPTGRRLTAAMFGIDIFSQNEIEGIAGNARQQLKLIDSFESLDIERKNQEIMAAVAELKSNASDIASCGQTIAKLVQEVEERQALEDQLDRLAAISDSTSEDVGRANTQRSLREKEKNQADSIGKMYDYFQHLLGEVMNRIEQKSRCFEADVIGGESANGDIIGRMRRNFRDYLTEFHDTIAALEQNSVSSREKFEEDRTALEVSQQSQEQEYLELIEKANADRTLVAERMSLERRLNRILDKARELEESRQRERQLLERRTGLLQRLARSRNEVFAIRDGIARRINDSLAPVIRVSVTQFGNTEMYQQELVAWLKKTPYVIQHRQVAQKIAERYSPCEFLQFVRGRRSAEISSSLVLNQNQTNAVMAAFANPEAGFALEVVPSPDLVVIELNDNGTFKETGRLSTGQKCNAILPIVMLESKRPLIVDQPEDNLDNRFIHRSIVRSLLKVKDKRQLILITHNPNIPVLSNAEKMLVMASDGSRGRIAREGTIDECKEEIVSLLEGGAEAFLRRQQRYDLQKEDN